jgi:hypothetical protein
MYKNHVNSSVDACISGNIKLEHVITCTFGCTNGEMHVESFSDGGYPPQHHLCLCHCPPPIFPSAIVKVVLVQYAICSIIYCLSQQLILRFFLSIIIILYWCIHKHTCPGCAEDVMNGRGSIALKSTKLTMMGASRH